MTLSDFRRITDEMLSAYIDGEVTEQERALIEAAIAADEEIAWRLNSLRQTVNLLRDLPELSLPRSFTLSVEQAREPVGVVAGIGAAEQQPALAPRALPALAPSAAPKAAPKIETIPGFWDQVQRGWQNFWQAGNPLLRNAAAVSFALMLVLAGSGQILTRALSQPVAMTASSPAPAAASASEAAAPAAAEMVALAPTETVQEPLLSQSAPASNKMADENDMARQAVSVEEPAAVGEVATEVPAESAAAAAAPAAEPVESLAMEEVSSEAAEGEAADQSAVAESASVEAAAVASDESTAQTAPEAEAAAAAEEPQAEMAMVVPQQPLPEAQDSGGPSMEEAPFPGPPAVRGQSGGGGAGGEGMALAPGMSAPDTGFPPQAQGFDVDPMAESATIPTEVPAEEAVSASAAAAPAEEAAEEAPADMVATPAVAAVTVEGAPAESEAAQEGSTEESSDAAQVAAEVPAPTATISEGEETTASSVAVVTTEPTAEVVAILAPEPITSSDVVENAPNEAPGIVTGPQSNLPVVWIAQGSFLLLTVLLTTLWWRSRTPRRRR